MSPLHNRRRPLNANATALLGQTFLSCNFGRTLPALLLALGLGVVAAPAQAANFNVANEAQLADAVAKAANGDTITFTADIELSAKGKAGTITTNVTINGNGHKLLGKAGANANGLYVQSGTVTIQNLDLSGLTTKGTSGGNGGGGGGGGAGTGAGLFVGAAANVTLANVALQNNSAVGGNGGVGVTEYGRTTAQGGGGGGSGPNAGNGQTSSGGAVGHGGPIGGGDGNGGNGQWGAGGGGSGSVGAAKGGNGGFGGGGGGGQDNNIGTGGFLGGNGGAGRAAGGTSSNWYNGGGGGGAGMGGAVFVQDGGKLSVTGTLTIIDNSVAGGTGGSSTAGAGGNGAAAGAGLFLAGNGTLGLSSVAGETQTISDAITDQTGAGGTGANAGSWGLVKTGAGTLTLTGANSYTGGTTVSGGVLRGNSTSLKGGIVNNASVVFDQTAAGIYAGSMSGTGALTVTGGKLTLTGANTYTGLTSVTGSGTLDVTAANTLAAASTVALDNGALLIGSGVGISNAITVTNRGGLGSNGGIATVSGVISGSGALDVNAGTVALAANNTFSGGLNVTGGATALFTADANLGAAGGSVTVTDGGMVGAAANAAANFETNRNLTVTGTGGISGAQHAVNWKGAVGGAGTLVVSGANVVELSGTNTYSGGTSIQGGALKVDSDARLGDLAGTLAFSNNGRLLASQSFTTGRDINVGTGGGGFELGAGTTLGLSGTITGGVVNQTGQGTLVVTGANSNAGFANYGGTLEGSSATLGRAIRFDSDVSNTNSRTVVFAQATDGTFTGNIGSTGSTPGLGNVVKTGAGKLTLMGESNFKSQVAGTAEFQVQEGTLQGNSKSLAGNIENNAALIFDQSFDGTYAGAITGTGSVTVSGAGKLTLDAASTIAGATSVTGGGILVTTTASNFGASSTLGLNGGTLMLGTGATAFNKAVTVTGIGGIAATGGTTPNNAVATMSGVISGAGQLDVNSNTVILAANNTFTGGLRVIGSNAQALFTTDANLGAAGQAITLQNGGVVGTTADAAPNLTMTRNLNIIGSGGLSSALHPLVYAGTISGNGTFIKSGGGIVNLTGTNNATGGTAVRAGTLQVASDDKLGAAGAGLELSENGHLWATESFTTSRDITLGGVAGGGFQLDSGTTLTLTGAISGTTLSLLGTGTLVLNGTSTYAGITNSGGTIIGNTDTLKGDIIFDYNAGNTNARSIVFQQDAVYSIFAGNITGLGTETGYGTVVKTGAGTLVLTGETKFAGLADGYAFDVQQGYLEGSSKNLVGKIHIAEGAELTFKEIVDGTYAGGLEGEGQLAKNGEGTLIFNGINSALGGTTINTGTLVLNGTLNTAGEGTTVWGTLALNGTLNSAGDGTNIEYDGLLSVNGTLNGDVSVNKGGTLEGSSRINGKVTNKGGKINPGNSIGHITINGDFEFDDGEMVVEVNAEGESDRVIVVGAGHTATITAGTLSVIMEPGDYTPGTIYTIVTAEGGGTAHFDSITGGTAFLSPELFSDPQNLYLTLDFAADAFRSAGVTANQQAVGSILDLVNASGSAPALVNALANVPVGSGAAALQQLSGQPYADFATVNMRGSQLFMNTVGRQMANDRGAGLGGGQSVALDAPGLDGQSRFSAWVSAIGTKGSVDGNGNAADLSYSLGGTAFGIGYRVDPRVQIGIAGAYVGGSQSVDGFMGDGNTEAGSVALHGSFAEGPLYVDGLLGYAYASNDLERKIAVPGVFGIANGASSSNQFLGQIETGYRFPIDASSTSTITPFGRLQVVSVNQGGFTETGFSDFNLTASGQTLTSVRTTLGADFSTRLDVGGTAVELSTRLGWVHEFGDTTRPFTAAFTAAPWASFTVYGAPEPRDSALIGVGAQAQILENTTLFASYDAELGGGSDNHQLWGGIRFSW
ncbi:autotransporter domain-containing protein [Ancylobacter rudongensis]|uniref:Autotransporter-associated beta strand repeat-containing protein n=1 Tax=Ancylobacter rudongensis TaxID=177413 RepID=A0A1G4RQD1_9HYPH|nr:autotransporter domain-containing protein [Ancylobacter rudongensis]SCW58976.1 autotransporter-associated beta strand repeat-containing protein [Ancylobacter rudongensis]